MYTNQPFSMTLMERYLLILFTVVFTMYFFKICLYKIFFLSSQYSIILRKSFPILRFFKNHLFCDRGYSPQILFPIIREPWNVPGSPMVKTLPSSREVKVKVTQLCLTLCDRPEYWSGQPFLSPGHLPNQGIEPLSVSDSLRLHGLQHAGLPCLFTNSAQLFSSRSFMVSFLYLSL